MNGVDLFLLGRTLMKIGEAAMPTQGLGTQGVRSVLIVVGDIRRHAKTSVGQIAGRTGLPQSAVSAAVARLREAGAVVTSTDPADRRRVLVETVARVSDRVTEVRAASIDDALATALDTTDGDEVADVTATLERLAARLDPTAVTRLRP